MVITEVRIKLCEANSERLLAFCSVTFDNAFVVRDLKIIEGTKGMFVAMPSRKLTDRCGKCSCKNHLRARFCNSCGSRLDESRAMRDVEGRAKLHADIAHPIHSGAREQIQSAVIKAFAEERERAKLPGYICTYDDYDYDADDLPVSYGSMVSEMGKSVRAHSPHSAPKGTHFHTEAPVGKSVAKAVDEFGAGIG
ncbi:MAG: stage V sporulation protein G [Planctomycetaceae bacterium]|nr:stage V sporulation protein G [Planctomycetaceae bacterium]